MTRIARKARKGFTLVELLIVMVIIGILAGTMMLTMGGGKGKAEATRIVSDLRNLKAAATMYYIDNSEWPGGSAETDAMAWVTESLDKYLDRDYPDGDSIDYYAVKDNSNRVFVGYGAITDNAVKESLKAMAADAALYGTNGFGNPESSDIETQTYYTDQHDYVWMLVTR
ncbi:MAG: prepilin-type N-terminal cleavage/methylation domain-containing protein [Synergistota bacterium]|nr:prepilin-type N-terminal cleavage/methylation domain-containing protein [Synergistota bacterium]